MPYNSDRHGPRRIVGPGFHARVYALVEQVPRGAVTTYGDVAGALGSRTVARQVGFALAALFNSGANVPWHRVINGQGRISFRGEDARGQEQRRRLEREGVVFDAAGKIVDFVARRHRYGAPDLEEGDRPEGGSEPVAAVTQSEPRRHRAAPSDEATTRAACFSAGYGGRVE